jgi:hypothetical protein
MSVLFLANFLVFQWFFIRLAKVVDDKTGKTTGYFWITNVAPLSGWWNDYKYL